MTGQSAAVRAADVVQLDDWRDWHVVKNAVRTGGLPLGWDSLRSFNAPGTRDKQTAIRVYERLGLHPILLHGVQADGSCTCGRAECIDSTGKHPVFSGWQTAALDVDRIDRALAENFRFNVGLRMGPQPGGFTLVTIDVDGERELLAPLEREHGALPPTLTASSGKGLHLIFKLADGVAAPKNRVRLAPGVDVRSERGQIVAAPSTHRSGRVYQWLDVREPVELPS